MRAASLVSGGAQNRPQERFGTPVLIFVFGCKPVQKSGVGRPFSLGPKILDGFHNSRPKDLLPNSIDCHPSNQRLVVLK